MQKSIIKELLILILVYSSLNLSAQENLVNGFIINHEDSVINGLLDNQQWSNNPEKIRFKAENSNEFIYYFAKDIKAVGTRDSSVLYLSAEVDIELSSININDLSENSSFDIKSDLVFIKKLVGGEKNLYQYKVAGGKDNFYFDLDGQYNLLLYKKYINKADGKNSLNEKKKYIGQLLFYLGSTPDIESKITKTGYNQNDLMALYQLYYKKSGSSSLYEYQESDIKLFTRKIYLGANYTTLNFSSKEDIFNYLSDVDFGHSIRPITGFALVYQFKDKFKNISNVNEIFHTSYYFKGSFYEESNPEVYANIDTKIGFTYFKINNLLSYQFLNFSKNYNLFINAGISTGFIFGNINSQTRNSRFYSTTRTSTEKAVPSVKRYENGLVIGTGFGFKKYSLELRHEVSTGMSNIMSLVSAVNRTSLLLSIKFK